MNHFANNVQITRKVASDELPHANTLSKGQTIGIKTTDDSMFRVSEPSVASSSSSPSPNPLLPHHPAVPPRTLCCLIIQQSLPEPSVASSSSSPSPNPLLPHHPAVPPRTLCYHTIQYIKMM